jgi:hypothetical protein
VLADSREADGISNCARGSNASVEGCTKQDYAVLIVIGVGVKD